MRKVVITGLGILSPLGRGILPNWQQLIQGKSAITKITRFDISDYACQIAGELPPENEAGTILHLDDAIDFKERRRVDPFIVYAMCAGKDAIDDAGIANFSDEDKVRLYSVFGGIPYYLSLIQPDDSVASAVDRLFYSEDAELKGEYDRLFKSLYKSPEPYLKIIEILCKSRDGLTRDEIANKMAGRDNGHLSDYLDNLKKCDFIRVYFVKDSLGKTLKKTGGIYQIMDLFTIFHNSFLTRPSTDPHFWSNHLDTPTLNTWFGLAFEKICAYHINQIKHALRIDAIGTEYFSWRSKANPPKAQIDLLIERADRKTNICEVKYSESDYSLQKDEDAKIRNRISTYREESRTRYSLLPILVTTYGLRQGKYSSLFKSVITMDQLFVQTE